MGDKSKLILDTSEQKPGDGTSVEKNLRTRTFVAGNNNPNLTAFKHSLLVLMFNRIFFFMRKKCFFQISFVFKLVLNLVDKSTQRLMLYHASE